MYKPQERCYWVNVSSEFSFLLFFSRVSFFNLHYGDRYSRPGRDPDGNGSEARERFRD